MRFLVRHLRHHGRAVVWRDVINRPPLVGDLRIEECMDEELRRHVLAAKLIDPGDMRGAARHPELLDVRLVAMSPQAFTLTGFERIDGATYGQSWLVTKVEP
jgi:hypothetical protein